MGPKKKGGGKKGGGGHDRTSRRHTLQTLLILFTRCSFNVVMIDAATGFSLQHNVFLRNKPAETEHGSTAVPLGRPRLFGYGTTDLILGYADATTIVSHNDFVLRGEYEGGPDGCAIDLETDCHNLVIGPDNNFWKNVGASVNVFGHAFGMFAGEDASAAVLRYSRQPHPTGYT